MAADDTNGRRGGRVLHTSQYMVVERDGKRFIQTLRLPMRVINASCKLSFNTALEGTGNFPRPLKMIKCFNSRLR